MDEMAAEVAAATGVTVEALRGPRRIAEVAQPRQALMHRAHAAGRGLSQIGRWLRRDHTTVLHGIRAHEKRYAAGEVDHLGRPT